MCEWVAGQPSTIPEHQGRKTFSNNYGNILIDTELCWFFLTSQSALLFFATCTQESWMKHTHTSRKLTLAQRQHANTSSLYYKLSADAMATGLCVWHFHRIGNPVLSSAILTCKMMSERKRSSSIMYMLAPCKQKPWAAVHMDLKWQTKRGCLEQPAVSINNKVFELERKTFWKSESTPVNVTDGCVDGDSRTSILRPQDIGW